MDSIISCFVRIVAMKLHCVDCGLFVGKGLSAQYDQMLSVGQKFTEKLRECQPTSHLLRAFRAHDSTFLLLLVTPSKGVYCRPLSIVALL